MELNSVIQSKYTAKDSEKVKPYFTFDHASNKSECVLCKTSLTGQKTGGRKRHLETLHPFIASEIQLVTKRHGIKRTIEVPAEGQPAAKKAKKLKVNTIFWEKSNNDLIKGK